MSDGKAEEQDELEVLALATTANHAPVVGVVMPATGEVGKSVRAEVTASDEDGDGLTISYELGRPTAAGAAGRRRDPQPSFVPRPARPLPPDGGRRRRPGRDAEQYGSTSVYLRSEADAGASPDAPASSMHPAYRTGLRPRDGGIS